MFTCIAVRAVHIELVEEISSSALINALQRFVCKRGSVKELCSDRETNFVGTLDALRVNSMFVEKTSVRDFLHKSGVICKFSPFHVSHMGVLEKGLCNGYHAMYSSLLLLLLCFYEYSLFYSFSKIVFGVICRCCYNWIK